MKLPPTLEQIDEQIENFTTVTADMFLALKHCRKFLETLTPVLVEIQQTASAENLPGTEVPK